VLSERHLVKHPINTAEITKGSRFRVDREEQPTLKLSMIRLIPNAFNSRRAVMERPRFFITLEQGTRILAILGIYRDANAGIDIMAAVRHPERFCEGLQEAFHRTAGVRAGTQALEYDRELVTPHTRHQVRLPHDGGGCFIFAGGIPTLSLRICNKRTRLCHSAVGYSISATGFPNAVN
jgi:hypothetical protein